MDKIELLSPAGNMDSLIAAVENGANAVYVGGKCFSARQYAENFDDTQLKVAVDYCHIRGVRVFITLNILLKDFEIQSIPDYVVKLYNMGVDALIIQDLGVGYLIKQIMPEFELHASTQMTAHNLESVNFLYSLGYKRVVLSRELSLKEIEFISLNTSAEIEVFCHGALCICYSGQCLMSSMIGGRSGNRGKCAQPCRQKYTFNYNEKDLFSGYVMSPKDLNTIEYLDLLLKSGIKSLKIEGRMKRAEYVAIVTSIYRKAIDNYFNYCNTGISEDDKNKLIKIFNRGGFTTAHLFNNGGNEMMSIDTPKNRGIYIGDISRVFLSEGKLEIKLKNELSKGDGIEIWTGNEDSLGYKVDNIIIDQKKVDKCLMDTTVILEYKGGNRGDRVYKTYDELLIKEAQKTYSSSDPLLKLPVECCIDIKVNKPAYLEMIDDCGNCAYINGAVPEVAVKAPLTESKIKDQISKLGGTPFYINKFSIQLDNNLSLPASSINSMRREAVNTIENIRINKARPKKMAGIYEIKKASNLLKNYTPKEGKDVKVSVSLKDSSMIDYAIDSGADIIIFGGDKINGFDFDYMTAIKKCCDRKVNIYIKSPRIIKNEFLDIIYELNKAIDYGASGIYAENMGILKYATDKCIPLLAGASFNVFNLITAKLLINMGCSSIAVSPELKINEIKGIAPYIDNCEMLCYGRVEMMVSEHCPAKDLCIERSSKNIESHLCKSGKIFLKDRMNMEFPLLTDNYCRSHIYNSKILSILPNINDIIDSGVNIIQISILDEKAEDIKNIIKDFKYSIDLYTRNKNSTQRKLVNIQNKIKNPGFTKGNYYRGVE